MTMVEEFLINRDKEETKQTIDFAKAILALEIEIKNIKEDQKAIKAEAKNEGVSVQKVTQVLNAMKKALKTKESDLAELDEIENVLSSDVDIKTQLAELCRK